MKIRRSEIVEGFVRRTLKSCNVVIRFWCHAVKSLVYRTRSHTWSLHSDPNEEGKAVKQGHYSVCEMHLRYELIAVAIVAIVDVTVMTVSSAAMKLGFTTLMRHKDPSETRGITSFRKWMPLSRCHSFHYLAIVSRKNDKMDGLMITTPEVWWPIEQLMFGC